MRSLAPYLAVLDAAFLAATGALSADCGTATGGDGGTDGSPSDAILSPDIVFGGCVEAGSAITYELCTDASAEDACAGNCTTACDRVFVSINSCTDDGTDGGTAFATCVHTLCKGGRRPMGLRRPRARRRGTPVARWLAGAAWMEGASVPAFERLARELAAHGAPRWLVDEAMRAAGDEVRHAEVMGALARTHGVRVPRARLRSLKPRSLATIARENAVEGCVHETFAALLASTQAERATDIEIRRAMGRIARDEKRHAALAYAVSDWLRGRLTATQRRRVEDARRTACDRVTRDSLRTPPIPAAGLVGGQQAHQLAQRLFQMCVVPSEAAAPSNCVPRRPTR